MPETASPNLQKMFLRQFRRTWNCRLLALGAVNGPSRPPNRLSLFDDRLIRAGRALDVESRLPAAEKINAAGLGIRFYTVAASDIDDRELVRRQLAV
jgi:hypothetical protein